MHRKHLKMLADYLMKLPKDYTHFGMEDFHELDFPGEITESHCGTSACAAGHAPYVDGLPKPQDGETWTLYILRLFELSAIEFEWCFDSVWSLTDNTPHGAAKRIYWMLENGVPDNISKQLWGNAPLCYKAAS